MITRAQIRRQLRKNGGIMNAVPRQGHFSGGIGGGIIQGTPMGSRTGYFNPLKIVKKAADKVLDIGSQVIKSPIGKAALLGLGGAGLMGYGPMSGMLSGIGPKFSGAKNFLFGTAGLPGSRVGEAFSKYVPGTKGALAKMGLTGGFGSKMPTAFGGITGASLLTYFMSKGKTEEEAKELAQDVYRGKGLGLDLIQADMQKYRSGDEDASQMFSKGYRFLTPRNYMQAATGGRVGLANGSEGVEQMYLSDEAGVIPKKGNKGITKEDRNLTKEDFDSDKNYKRYIRQQNKKADGGRIGYADGTPEQIEARKKAALNTILNRFYERFPEKKDMPAEEVIRELQLADVLKYDFQGPAGVMGLEESLDMITPESVKNSLQRISRGDTQYGEMAQGGRIGKYGGGVTSAMPRIPTGMPRVNAGGISELDYRQEGGFVPMGVKEKADDVPAMLSKNEFVMTADAVKGAGGGNVEKGAQKMYDTMKQLEGRIA